VPWLHDRPDWAGLKSCLMIESVREIKASSPQTDIERERCFCVTSAGSPVRADLRRH
jgi:hypothetical protein